MGVRVGFLGVGYMGQLAHLHSFSRVPGCEVAAIAELRPALAKAVAEKYRVARVYRDHEELLADQSIDAVVCAQPYHRNYYLGKAVLDAGKALLTEKPMVARSEDARELVEIAERKGVVYGVGFMKRHDPGVHLAREAVAGFIESGELGALRMVDTTCFLGDWLQHPGAPITSGEPEPEDEFVARYPEFLSEALYEAYDHFLNIYSHNVNLLHFVLPAAPLVCETAVRAGESYLVSLRQGETLISLRGTPTRSHQWEESTVLFFEKGRVAIYSATPLNRQAVARVFVYREKAGLLSETQLFPPVEWAFERQAAAFIEAVGRGAALTTAGKHCVADVELMEEVFRQIGG
ncbi:MAG: Gfo/Idh/MocA family oxidoreductase [Candidatus Hydrogenedentes bacterium]|nr:Gfo/Idh/MocA family oxidoreductase [Candidatus Hydrogenedentota bacterium]